ncbi:MAG: hypothetical protein ACON42_01370 [Flavobacteriaceae bacterium]
MSLIALFERYLNYHFHVALAVVCLFGMTTHFLQLRLDELHYFGVGACSWLGYYFITHLSQKRTTTTLIWSLIGAALSSWYIVQLPSTAQLVCGVCALLVMCYPNISGLQYGGLREKPGWKVVVVALTWTIFCVGLAVSLSERMPAFHLIIQVSFFIFLYVLAAMIPFEIRDLPTDHPRLQTLVHRLGEQCSRTIGYLLTLLILLLLIGMPVSSFSKIWIAVWVGFLTWSIYVNPRTSPYFCSFWVEAIPIFMYAGPWLVGS